MPHITTDISPDGPLIDLYLGVSAPHAKFFVSRKQAVPGPVKIRGMIDTGSQHHLFGHKNCRVAEAQGNWQCVDHDAFDRKFDR